MGFYDPIPYDPYSMNPTEYFKKLREQGFDMEFCRKMKRRAEFLDRISQANNLDDVKDILADVIKHLP